MTGRRPAATWESETASQPERALNPQEETASMGDGARAVDLTAEVGELHAGAVIDRYTILERVGTGGMGSVYAAYDAKLDRKVALKVLKQHSANYGARLAREAQAMARLSHPNVIAVYDTGKVGDRLYLTMEFVRGKTLRQWQEGRDWREVLAAYLAAGAGLAAAHDAGLVHRDFKPDNVLVSETGLVKVGDFGIARAVEARSVADVTGPNPAASSGPSVAPPPLDPEPAESGTTLKTGGSLGEPMTQAGTLLGTPIYMAPEQFRCEAVDLRTDEFAFCIALHEALYKTRPFARSDVSPRQPGGLDAIRLATLAGRMIPPPRGSKVPSHVYEVLVRGLRTRPADRYPSMGPLLADLAREPGRRRMRVGAGAAIACVLVSATALGARAMREGRASLCRATAAEAHEAWSDEIAARAEQGILATGVPYAPDTWRRTREHIDAYMKKWSEAHKETCEATRIRGTQTEAVMALRMSCLDQRRSEVRALVQVLSTADRDVAAKALHASLSLTSVDVCRDVASLSAIAPEPVAEDDQAELKRIRTTLASVKENLGAGRAGVARGEVMPMVGRARALGYAPLEAESLLLSARAKAGSGIAREESIADAIEAVSQADAGRAELLRAEAAILLMGWLKDAGNLAEAERWATAAEGALERGNERGVLRAEWLRVTGRMLFEKGRYEESAARCRDALELGRAAKVSPQQLADLERGIALAVATLGRKEEAERTIAEAEDLLVRTMGPEHPTRIRFIEAHGFINGAAGDNRAALAHHRRAIELAERVAPNDDTLPMAYVNACSSLNNLGDHAGALPVCEEALKRSLTLYGKVSMTSAYAYTNTGDALAGLRRYDAARTHYEASVSIHEKTGATTETDYISALAGLGQVLFFSGKSEAAEPLSRAIVIAADVARSSEMEAVVAGAEFSLARVLFRARPRDAKVSELAKRASATYARLEKEAEAREVDEWRSTHLR